MALDLFKPVVDPERFHPHFRHVAFSPDLDAERQILKGWAEGFLDRDGKFIEEFQTTFNSGFWELYLNATFRYVGCTIDYSHFAPDFVLRSDGIEFVAEAATASHAEGCAPESEALSVAKALRDFDKAAFLEFATIRLSNTITSKHRKCVEEYKKLGWVQGKPFVLCVAPFEQPFAFEQNDHAFRRVLYGFDLPLTTEVVRTA